MLMDSFNDTQYVAGHCSVHGQPGTHETAIFEVDVGAEHSGETYGSFDFTIPHCAERFQFDAHYHEPFYEVQYVRNFEVLGRVTAANESVTEPHVFNNGSDSYFDTLGLEHLFAVIGIIASIAFASAYYMRVRRESRGMQYGGLDCFSSHGDDEDMVVLNNPPDDSSYQL